MDIVFDRIKKAIDNQILFDDWSLEIKSGEKVAVSGPSGSGKTTLIKFMLGFGFPDEGSLSIKGQKMEPERAAELRRYVAWQPQEAAMGMGKTEDVIYGPFEFEINRDARPDRSKVQETASELGLGEQVMSRNFTSLSGGERQRVALLVAYLMPRPILLLDEPTASLDPASRNRVIDLFLKGDKRTILSTSHDEEWNKACDRNIPLPAFESYH